MLAAPPQELGYEATPGPQPAGGNPRGRAQARGRARRKLFILGLVLLAIVMAFGKTFLAVRLVINGYEMEALKQQINTLQRENERLQLEVARLKAPERVARVATTRLGMVEPAEGQLYYVPGKASQQVQVAAGATAGPGTAAATTAAALPAPPHHSWLASLAAALQSWFEPARVARAGG
ncbi:MAG: hypothetical protein PWQ18_1105 [Clostridia bacterium]|nr:hypothetical protein [Clostridia bacterium]